MEVDDLYNEEEQMETEEEETLGLDKAIIRVFFNINTVQQ